MNDEENGRKQHKVVTAPPEGRHYEPRVNGPIRNNMFHESAEGCIHEIVAPNQLIVTGRVRPVSTNINRKDEVEIERDFIGHNNVDFRLVAMHEDYHYWEVRVGGKPIETSEGNPAFFRADAIRIFAK